MDIIRCVMKVDNGALEDTSGDEATRKLVNCVAEFGTDRRFTPRSLEHGQEKQQIAARAWCSVPTSTQTRIKESTRPV